MRRRTNKRALLRQSVLGVVVLSLLLSPWAGLATATEDSVASPDKDGSVGSWTSLALDADDRPVISYYDATNGDLKVLHCGNPDCTSGNVVATPDTGAISAQAAAPEPEVGMYTSLALDGAGNPVVSYYDVTNRDLKLLRCGNETCTFGNSITSPDTDGSVGTWTSLALDADSHPVVSYHDGTNGVLRVLHCGDPTCSSGNTIESPDPDGANGLYSSLELDASGNPVVSYHDIDNTALKVLHCGDPTCTSGNTITSPDTEGWVGKYTSLVLDAAGNPVISHCDFSHSDLKVLHCGDPECSSGNTDASPDTEGFVGAFTSIALDAYGNPVVSYTGDSNLELRVLHCGNAACTGGNVTTSPDPGGGGAFTSVALDARGLPVVSYVDGRLADLKVLHCSGPDCTGTKPAVGGVVELPAAAGQQLAKSSSDAPITAVLVVIAAITAGAATLGGLAWYTRRRRAG